MFFDGEQNSVGATTHPARIKAGERAIDFNTIDVCQRKDFIDPAERTRVPKQNTA